LSQCKWSLRISYAPTRETPFALVGKFLTGPSRMHGKRNFDFHKKVAKQLRPVARLPQEIRDRAIAVRNPIRYHEILLVKHPSLPVQMRAVNPGTRRGFFQMRTSSPFTSPRRKRPTCRSCRRVRPLALAPRARGRHRSPPRFRGRFSSSALPVSPPLPAPP